jgi:hypothetical protein
LGGLVLNLLSGLGNFGLARLAELLKFKGVLAL